MKADAGQMALSMGLPQKGSRVVVRGEERWGAGKVTEVIDGDKVFPRFYEDDGTLVTGLIYRVEWYCKHGHYKATSLVVLED